MTARLALAVLIAAAFMAGAFVGRASASRPQPHGIPAAAPVASRTPEAGTEAPSAVRDCPVVAACSAPSRSAVPPVELAPTAAPQPTSVSVSGHTLSGVASWFCSSTSPCTRGWPPSCLCAAAGPALRHALGPGWRGSVVTVTASGHSVQVRLSDFCSCGTGRIIDLYSVAFARLTPLSRGVLRVSVTWP